MALLQSAFSRIRKQAQRHEYSLEALEEYAVILGCTLLRSGRADEAEANIRECLERPGPYGHTNREILISTAFRAELLLMQGRREEGLALVEGMGGGTCLTGDWAPIATHYCMKLPSMRKLMPWAELDLFLSSPPCCSTGTVLRQLHKPRTFVGQPSMSGAGGRGRGGSVPVGSRGTVQFGEG